MKQYNRPNMTVSRKRKQPDCDPVILHERINTKALEEVAQCYAAGVWQPNETGPTLRKIIADMLVQISEGSLTNIWREEERMQRLSLEWMRYSGFPSRDMHQ